MSYSHPNLPPSPPLSPQDRDSMRDRLKDLEHATNDLKETQDDHGTRLKWHEAALGLILWLLANTKLAQWSPEMGEAIGHFLRGWSK